MKQNGFISEEEAIVFNKAQRFMYRNARPLDFARWKFHFENGSEEAVLSILETYQNEDGGFGNGLEEDCFNPNSSPIQTWKATEILRDIHFTDKDHPIVKGIMNYLASGGDFDYKHRQWMNIVPSNNDYPHAIWWEYKEGEDWFNYNPTASLAGFILKYGDIDSEIYKLALELAKEAYRYWMNSMPYAEQHVTACFIRLYEYCMEAGVEIADMDEFKQKLIEQVATELDSVTDKWGTDYVCMPTNFIKTKDSIFYEGNAGLVAKECDYILQHQSEDGSFPITWQWWTDYKEFEISKNWWKADLCITNMRFLREFNK